MKSTTEINFSYVMTLGCEEGFSFTTKQSLSKTLLGQGIAFPYDTRKRHINFYPEKIKSKDLCFNINRNFRVEIPESFGLNKQNIRNCHK